jgi:acetoacetate decarboxylase
MLKRKVFAITAVCMFAVLTVSLLLCSSACKDRKAVPPARTSFVPSPEFSPPYPPLPHHFNNNRGIQILCQAPKGAIQRALPRPLEQNGDDDRFVLLMGWSPDCEGFTVHEIAIDAPVKWKDRAGMTTLIEYIDSDMGLIAGREIWGWPKKMSDIVWTQTETGWTVTCNKQKDQGNIPLIKVEYTISDSAPSVEWPSIIPTLLVKRIPNASPSIPPLTQLVCVGCAPPPGGGSSPAMPKPAKETKGFAAVQFFDGPHDPLTFLGPVKVLGAKMSFFEGPMDDGLGLGEVLSQLEE